MSTSEHNIKLFLASAPGVTHPLVVQTDPEQGAVDHALEKVVQNFSTFGFECLVASSLYILCKAKQVAVWSGSLLVVLSYFLKLFGSKDSGSPHFRDCRVMIGQKSAVPLDMLMPNLDQMSPKTIFGSRSDLVERVRSRVGLVTLHSDGQHSVRGFPVTLRNISKIAVSSDQMVKNLVTCMRSGPIDVPLRHPVAIPSRKMGRSPTSEFELVFANEFVVFRSNMNMDRAEFVERITAELENYQAPQQVTAENQEMNQFQDPMPQSPRLMPMANIPAAAAGAPYSFSNIASSHVIPLPRYSPNDLPQLPTLNDASNDPNSQDRNDDHDTRAATVTEENEDENLKDDDEAEAARMDGESNDTDFVSFTTEGSHQSRSSNFSSTVAATVTSSPPSRGCRRKREDDDHDESRMDDNDSVREIEEPTSKRVRSTRPADDEYNLDNPDRSNDISDHHNVLTRSTYSSSFPHEQHQYVPSAQPEFILPPMDSPFPRPTCVTDPLLPASPSDDHLLPLYEDLSPEQQAFEDSLLNQEY